MNAGDIYDEFFIEIQMVMRRYQKSAAKIEDERELLALRREENAALLDLLHQQERALKYAAGDMVEPETLFAKAIIPVKVGQ